MAADRPGCRGVDAGALRVELSPDVGREGVVAAWEDAALHGGTLQAWGRPGEGTEFINGDIISVDGGEYITGS